MSGSAGEVSTNPKHGTKQRSFWRRNRWIWWVSGAAFVFLAVAAILLTIVARRFEPYVRARIVEGLEQRFHARVELADFHIHVQHGQEAQWGLWARGRGLRIWPPHRAGGDPALDTALQSKPLIDLGEFSFHVPLRYEMTQHLRIAEVRLKNLVIQVPPRSERNKLSAPHSATGVASQAESARPGALAFITVDRVICDGGDITLETDKPNRVPLDFPITQLRLRNLAIGRPMEFEAELTNPRPRGTVHTSGTFGPWDVDDPGESPVNGKYQFDHADLSTFNGIAGILASTGNYGGTLQQLQVDGEADVPDFRLSGFGNPLALKTKFHARVDATNGDTWLEPVDATLGRSHFTTQGKVVRVLPGPLREAAENRALGKPAAGKTVLEGPVAITPEVIAKFGHLIDLKVSVDRGYLEDFMRLVSRSPSPLLIGPVTAQANLHIPPGQEPVHMRLKLDGHFKLEDARFTDPKVQDKVEELSLRGQGHPGAMKHTDADTIHSAMESDFHLEHGVVTLPDLKYEVPGADIEIHGDFAFDGRVKFEGTARMEATVSQMVGGWKGFLLKPVDRFFRKDGAGALIPIHIRGTRDAPEFGVDFSRLKETSPQKPGETDKPEEKEQTHPEKPGEKPEKRH